jgi:hypothetical protein
MAKATGDRSADTFRIVAACYDDSLVLAQSRWAVAQRADLTERLAGRNDDDVLTCWLRVIDDRNSQLTITGSSAPVSDSGESEAPAGNSGHSVRLQTADTISDGVPEWAWEHDDKGRLQRATVVLFAGRPAAGKSTAGRFFAGGFSQGTINGCFEGKPVNVAYIAAEESIKYMVKPSLRAHGADMTRIHFPKVQFAGQEVRLQSVRDEQLLLETLVQHDVKVVFVDPIMSTIGGNVDVHRTNETRTYVEPWQRIAEAINGLVVGIVHLRKQFGTDVVAAINGSSAFGEIARAVIAFARDDDGERVLSQEKNSAGDDDLALCYRIEPTTVQTDEGPAEVGRFVLGGPSERRVADVLRADSAHERFGSLSLEVLEAVREVGKACGPTDVAALVEGLSTDMAGKYMRRLAKAGLLVKHKRGLFTLPGNGA